MHRNTSEHIAQGARWMACCETELIAETVKQTPQAINRFLQKKKEEYQGKDSFVFRDFEPKIYTAWSWRPPTETRENFPNSTRARVDLA